MVPLVLARPTIHVLRVFLLASILIVTAAALASPQSVPAPAPPAASAKADACALLSREEIRAVQGSELRRAVPSAPESAAFHVSQCYFEAAVASRSVSLMLASPDPHKSVRPRDFWNQHFHPAEKEGKEAKTVKTAKAEKEPREDDEEDKAKLRAVAGLGYEAYWEASAVAGALYVLRKDTFLRISVGGADTDDARLEKARKLATHALARLGQ